MTARRLIDGGWVRCQPRTRLLAAQIRAGLRTKTQPGSEGQK